MTPTEHQWLQDIGAAVNSLVASMATLVGAVGKLSLGTGGLTPAEAQELADTLADVKRIEDALHTA
jgi:hypothetical protein